MDYLKKLGFGETSSILELLESFNTQDDMEQKKQTLDEILQISSSNAYAFDESCISSILDLLHKHRDSVSLSKLFLEIISNIVEEPNQSHSDTCLNFLAQEEREGGVGDLLDLLENDSYKLRFLTTKVFKRLLEHNTPLLQRKLLSIPMGTSKLINTLQDSRDIIRNESLLVLSELIRNTGENEEEIKKIVAFQGAFERLFEIINEDGLSQGGIVVSDCLDLILNLLDNPFNQKYFRETGCIPRIPELLSLGDQDPSTIKGKQKDNIQKILSVVYELVSGATDDIIGNQRSLVEAGVFRQVILPALDERFGEEINIMGMVTLGGMVYQCSQAQSIFRDYTLPNEDGTETLAMVKLIHLSIFDQVEERRKLAEETFKFVLADNPETQMFIASTVKPKGQGVAIEKETMLGGRIITSAMLDVEDVSKGLQCFHACSLMEAVLKNNDEAKGILMAMPYEITPEGEPPRLLDSVIKTTVSLIRAPKDVLPVIGLLKVLCRWISSFPSAAITFLNTSSNLICFIDLLTSEKRIDINLLGLGAIFMGLVVTLFNDKEAEASSQNSFTKEYVMDVFLRKIGLDRVSNIWDSFRRSKPFLRSELSFGEEEETSFVLYDKEFIEFLKTSYESIIQQILEQYVQDNQEEEEEEEEEENDESIDNNNNNNNNNNQLNGDIDNNNNSKSFSETTSKSSPINGYSSQQQKQQRSKLSLLVKQQQKEISRLKHDHEHLSAQVFKYENDPEIIDSKASINQLKQEHAQALEEKDSTIQEKDKAIEELKEKLGESENQIEKLNEDLKNKETDFQDKQSLSEEHIKSLQQQVENFEEQMQSFSNSYMQLEETLRQKDEEIETLENRLQELDQDPEQHLDQHFALKDEYENRIQELEQQVATLKSDIENKDQKIEELEDDTQDMLRILSEYEQAAEES